MLCVVTMNNETKTKALIYCRVSSERQAKEGHGLDSQEHRCREYARAKNYQVVDVFRDSYSGGGDYTHRPGMSNMLAFIDNRPLQEFVVIFDDLSRFARDVVFHFKLRQALKERGVKPECLNFNFDDSPEGEMVEAMMAAQNQYHRKSNRRQVIQKQKARLELGYWPFFPPPGYAQVKDSLHGKILKPVEPQASLIREAFEGFASDRFLSQTDVMNFLRDSGYSDGRPIYQEGVRRLLRRVVYAGYVEREEWGVVRRKGKHEGLVSLEVYEKVQAKLDGKYKIYTRVSDSLDFALRGFILCPFCQRPMTGSWSRGRTKMYRFYRCNTQSCVRHNKSVSGDRLDEDFKKLLGVIYPKVGAMQLTKAVLLDLWEKRVQTLDSQQARIERQLTDTRKQIDVLSARVVKAMDEKLASVYEEQIIKCQKESESLQEKLQTLGVSAVSFETALETVFGFIKNPLVIWESGDINAKRLTLKLVFAEKLAYHPKFGFETAQKSRFVGLFETISANNSQDVEMGGIEPPCKMDIQVGLQHVVYFGCGGRVKSKQKPLSSLFLLVRTTSETSRYPKLGICRPSPPSEQK